MLGPALFQWMKQGHHFLCLRIDGGELVGFMEAAIRTLKNQVPHGRRPNAAFGNDVVDVENRNLPELSQPAISAGALVTN